MNYTCCLGDLVSCLFDKIVQSPVICACRSVSKNKPTVLMAKEILQTVHHMPLWWVCFGSTMAFVSTKSLLSDSDPPQHTHTHTHTHMHTHKN